MSFDGKIVAACNVNYGGILINQKYSPLENIQISENGKDLCEKIFQNRITIFNNHGIFTADTKLHLFADWGNQPSEQDGLLPPMVVISSSRAWFLSKLFRSAKALEKSLQEEEENSLQGFNDGRVFREGIIPWFAPIRSGGRHCYVVVHSCEYDSYRRAFRDEAEAPFDDVTIVGYEYGEEKPDKKHLVGFGASRYAALAMTIHLGYRQAWLVDDNVVQINGFPDSLDAVEEDLEEGIAAIGFKGATKNISAGEVFQEIQFEDKYQFKEAEPGLLQQVVLWNLEFLKENKLCISPYFCTSQEDASFSTFLSGLDENSIKLVTSCSIIKLEIDSDLPPNDKSSDSKPKTGRFLLEILKLLFATEQSYQVNETSPDLFRFIQQKVLPESSRNNHEQIAKTVSQAVEQILSEAVERRWVPHEVFQFHHLNGQLVKMQSPDHIRVLQHPKFKRDQTNRGPAPPQNTENTLTNTEV